MTKKKEEDEKKRKGKEKKGKGRKRKRKPHICVHMMTVAVETGRFPAKVPAQRS